MENYFNRYRGRTNCVDRTIASYDEYTSSYYEKHGDFVPIQALINFQKYVSTGSRILDAGCGLGRDSQYLIQHGYPDTIGIDMSLGMLAYGKNSVGFQFFGIQGDFRYSPFADKSFAGIWAMASIIHTPREDVLELLLEFRRLLKKQGILYVSVIDGKGENAESGEEDSVKRGWRYFVFYERDEFSLIIEKAGFTKLLEWKNYTRNIPGSRQRIWWNFITQSSS
jgi:SAM-dependent methyltransferase